MLQAPRGSHSHASPHSASSNSLKLALSLLTSLWLWWVLFQISRSYLWLSEFTCISSFKSGSLPSHWFLVCSAFSCCEKWWLLSSLYIRVKTGNPQSYLLNLRVGTLGPVLLITTLTLNMLTLFQEQASALRACVVMNTWFGLWLRKFLIHCVIWKVWILTYFLSLQTCGNFPLNLKCEFHGDKYLSFFLNHFLARA